jgi:hypothetical protein
VASPGIFLPVIWRHSYRQNYFDWNRNNYVELNVITIHQFDEI